MLRVIQKKPQLGQIITSIRWDNCMLRKNFVKDLELAGHLPATTSSYNQWKRKTIHEKVTN